MYQTFNVKTLLKSEIFNKNRHLMYPNLTLRVYLRSQILMTDDFLYFFLCRKGNSFIYQTKDGTNTLILYDFCLTQIIKSTTTKEEKDIFYKSCQKNDLESKRLLEIDIEKIKLTKLDILIRTEIVHKLNFGKHPRDSHSQNAETKLTGKSNQTSFLYDIHTVSSERRNEIKKLTQKYINLPLVYETEPNKEKEQFYCHISVCRILKGIKQYQNHLDCCKQNIEQDAYNLNDNCAFNNIIPGKFYV